MFYEWKVVFEVGGYPFWITLEMVKIRMRPSAFYMDRRQLAGKSYADMMSALHGTGCKPAKLIRASCPRFIDSGEVVRAQ